LYQGYQALHVPLLVDANLSQQVLIPERSDRREEKGRLITGTVTPAEERAKRVLSNL